MKRIGIAAFLFCWACQTVVAQSVDDVFMQANKLYQESKFAEARDTYESIIHNGYESGSLYYNLGNAYFRLGDIARAILNYERGLRLAPTDDDLRYNLDLSQMLTVDKIEPAPRLFLWEYWDNLKGMFSPGGIVWTTYAAYVLMLAALALFLLGRGIRIRKVFFFTFAGAGIAFSLLLVIAVSRLSDLGRTDAAVITSQVVTAKNSPDEQSTDAFVLHAGTKVLIMDSVGDWMMIRLEDGKVGWMQAGSAEVI